MQAKSKLHIRVLGLADDAFQTKKVLRVEETLFLLKSETFKHKVCLWPASSKI